MTSLLLGLALAAGDGGASFRDSALGYRLAGQGVVALDERWVDDLGGRLLLRVVREGDSGAVVFYALTRDAQGDAGPVFEDRLSTVTLPAPELDSIQGVPLADLGRGLEVELHEALPDDRHSQLLVFGSGPRLLLSRTYLDPLADPSIVDLAPMPPKVSWRLDHGLPVVTVATDPKVLHFESPDGGVDVAVGYREWEGRPGGAASSGQDENYRDLFPPVSARSPAAPELVDHDLRTGATLRTGKPIRLELERITAIRMIRLVPSCTGKGGAARHVRLTIGDDASVDLELHQVVRDRRVRGSGVFDLGPGGGEQELVLFDPPQIGARLTLTLVEGDGPGGTACMAEVSVHADRRAGN